MRRHGDNLRSTGFAAASSVALLSSMAQAQVTTGLLPPYCADLKRVAVLASGSTRFEPITGKPRFGSYSDTTLPLAGWSDCLLYGERTYSCDSKALPTVEAARAEQRNILAELAACLPGDWAEDGARSTPAYVIVHHRGSRVSITLSTDQNERDEHVVRLIMFLR